MSQAKKVAQYARAVKEMGIEVQELLRQEDHDKDLRARTLQMLTLATDDDDQKTAAIVTKILDETNASLLRLTKKSAQKKAEENKLISAIEKKKNDVERNKKLLASLNIGVEPIHNDEYDRLQEELQVEYERYVTKVRNVDYLESELRSYHSILLQQRKRAAHKIRRMQDAYYREEETLQILEGGEGGDAYAVADTLSDDDTAPTRSDESLSAPSCDDMSGSVEAEEYDSDDSDSNF
eukprot:scaffold14637_cov141-Skeletonema_marinoi.AAC.8